MRLQLTVEEFITKFVDRVEFTNTCWVWRGYKNDQGYAIWPSQTGGTRRVARLSYMVFVGPLPKRLQVDHTCEYTGCVNPDHLIIATNSDNCRRRDGWKRKNCKWYCPKGHLVDYENSYYNKASKATQCRLCILEKRR